MLALSAGAWGQGWAMLLASRRESKLTAGQQRGQVLGTGGATRWEGGGEIKGEQGDQQEGAHDLKVRKEVEKQLQRKTRVQGVTCMTSRASTSRSPSLK